MLALELKHVAIHQKNRWSKGRILHHRWNTNRMVNLLDVEVNLLTMITNLLPVFGKLFECNDLLTVGIYIAFLQGEIFCHFHTFFIDCHHFMVQPDTVQRAIHIG